MKWDPAVRDATIARYIELTQAHGDADLVVWPETAIPAFDVTVRALLVELDAWARDQASALIIGIPMLDPDTGDYFNGVIALGEAEGRYRMRHLVPFGEFLPWYPLLEPLLAFWKLPVGNFRPGPETQRLVRIHGMPVGVSICYEDIFAREVLKALPSASLLVNVSNDAWFGDSIAPHQHEQMARMRALESGRYLIRATNTGVSSIIGPDGAVLAASPQFAVDVLRGEVSGRTGATPFVAGGRHFVVLPALAWFTILLIRATVSARSARGR